MARPRDAKRDDSLPPSFGYWLRELPNLPKIWSSPVRRVRLPATAQAASHRPAGQPVLVIPGIMSNDGATSLMRRTLNAAGYDAYPAQLGMMLTGITQAFFDRAEARLLEVHGKTGQKIVLVGISLGGLYARVLAQRHPDKVLLVMTLGTPFSGDRRANNAWRLYEAINDHKVDNPPLPDDPRIKPPMRTIAVWSPFDGVIAPACTRGGEGECDRAIQVTERHFEFSASRPSIERVIAILDEELARAD